SGDGGNTWDEEIYYLSTVLTYPEYSTNCVLPPELADGEPGMILSVLGDRPHALGLDRPGLMQAVRWRPLPADETASCGSAAAPHPRRGG
ncbi:MAG: hypothetical protein QGI83_21865, partial [Candidatus Latescibacteria bacterium]|nr:hypothetical protein [Candidatus Latescibacterota bacterium]